MARVTKETEYNELSSLASASNKLITTEVMG